MKKNKAIFLQTFLFLTFFLSNRYNAFSQNNAVENNQENVSKEQNFILSIDKIDTSRFTNIAVIQVLDKITAKTSVLEIKVNETVKFGKLTITAHKCWQSSLEQEPESKILLEIFENNDAKSLASGKTRIFFGWMFASSPSISVLENPIYDVTAVSCKNK